MSRPSAVVEAVLCRGWSTPCASRCGSRGKVFFRRRIARCGPDRLERVRGTAAFFPTVMSCTRVSFSVWCHYHLHAAGWGGMSDSRWAVGDLDPASAQSRCWRLGSSERPFVTSSCERLSLHVMPSMCVCVCVSCLGSGLSSLAARVVSQSGRGIAFRMWPNSSHCSPSLLGCEVCLVHLDVGLGGQHIVASVRLRVSLRKKEPLVTSLEPESYLALIHYGREWLVHFFLPENDNCKQMKMAFGRAAIELGTGADERGLSGDSKKASANTMLQAF